MSPLIAVIDDDEGCAALVGDVLEQAGCGRVRRFSSPVSAFRFVVSRGLPDLIVTDFLMPGMNGGVLLDEVRMLFGSVRAIVVTSDPEEALQSVREYPVLDKSSPDFAQSLVKAAMAAIGERSWVKDLGVGACTEQVEV